MFTKNFFPTPKKVIEKMLEPYNDENGYKSFKSILEPSAGKGDILNYLRENFNEHRTKVYCIEKNPELQAILREKHKLIGTDFLEYQGDYDFDLILMNPPFENGDEHLLKAWEILQNGDIVCLLNAETIKNPFSKTRKLLKNIIDENGTVEYLGDCFSDAERKTGVNVALVRLKKESESDRFDFSDMEDKENFQDFSEENLDNKVALRDALENIVIEYEEIKKYYLEKLKLQNKLKVKIERFNKYEYQTNDLIGDTGDIKENYNKFIDELKEKIWEFIIKKMNIEKYMTNNLRKDFSKYLREQCSMGITKKNILNLIDTIYQNRGNILEQAVGEVFDIFTKFHSENRLHIEGWKTNDKFKVNKKVILPYWVEWGEYGDSSYLKSRGDKFQTNHRGEYHDIDKVMCYLTGRQLEQIRTISDALENHFDRIGLVTTGEKFDNACESTFFNIKFWKKGTVHIEFKDTWLWKEFNMRACAGKNWLPEGEKREWQEQKKKEEHLRLC